MVSFDTGINIVGFLTLFQETLMLHV